MFLDIIKSSDTNNFSFVPYEFRQNFDLNIIRVMKLAKQNKSAADA